MHLTSNARLRETTLERETTLIDRVRNRVGGGEKRAHLEGWARHSFVTSKYSLRDAEEKEKLGRDLEEARIVI